MTAAEPDQDRCRCRFDYSQVAEAGCCLAVAEAGCCLAVAQGAAAAEEAEAIELAAEAEARSLRQVRALPLLRR